ncbi:hypothetical protein CROQUDRAFT_51709 [Cronartium quercuum f. sp. fusiforme G11]|uniref:HlyIII-domain-containing protein n=1 Tax=Cronartium quercuum f. sp. fusiforme G11 TaxID=708437 RepID=A0A9P6N8R5_9BASI|nr:hypothetical protein CROQUDRAFT_51709 [Cronartium quercuum f. sp. fusiforme G11]
MSNIQRRKEFEQKTISYEALSAWRKDNIYIRTGYRPELCSYVECIKSIFSYFHNETVNIHSHLWGAVIFFTLVMSLTSPSKFMPWTLPTWVGAGSVDKDTVTWVDTAVFACFYLSGMACLGFSATYHTVTCHSERVCATLGRLDYMGIVWLIVGSFYPAVYYGFYCYPKIVSAYLTLITTLGIGATYTVVTPKYRSQEGRKKRTLIFIALGLSSVLPIGHGALSQSGERIGLGWLALSGFTYIVGAMFYAERFPERFNPGTFDLVGSSHQIFHVLILFAALFHYFSITSAFVQ